MCLTHRMLVLEGALSNIYKFQDLTFDVSPCH